MIDKLTKIYWLGFHSIYDRLASNQKHPYTGMRETKDKKLWKLLKTLKNNAKSK